MAFPAIQAADTKNGTVTSNSSPWTLTYPTNLVLDDLIVAFAATDGSTQGTWPTNWTRTHFNSSGAASLLVGTKISDGTETGTFSLGLGANEQGGWRVFRVTDWFGSGIPASTGGTASHGNGVSWAAVTPGASANPDPPSLDPSNWATEDTLWFAVCSSDTSRTISVYPYADNNSADVSGGAGGATLGICTTESATSSLDPGTFTISTSDDWCTVTVAVRPAAAGPTPLARPINTELQAVARGSLW